MWSHAVAPKFIGCGLSVAGREVPVGEIDAGQLLELD